MHTRAISFVAFFLIRNVLQFAERLGLNTGEISFAECKWNGSIRSIAAVFYIRDLSPKKCDILSMDLAYTYATNAVTIPSHIRSHRN